MKEAAKGYGISILTNKGEVEIHLRSDSFINTYAFHRSRHRKLSSEATHAQASEEGDDANRELTLPYQPHWGYFGQVLLMYLAPGPLRAPTALPE